MTDTEAIVKKKKLPDKKPAEESKLVKAVQTGDNQISVHMVEDPFPQTGCRTKEGADALIVSCVKIFQNGDTALSVKEANDLFAMMAELKPQDAFEGLLISQMLMVHKQALHNLCKANLEGNMNRTDIQDSLINRYIKLMRLFNQQLEALDKHRRGGQQRMTVEHVHVNSGGQAIIGSVNQGGGGKGEK